MAYNKANWQNIDEKSCPNKGKSEKRISKITTEAVIIVILLNVAGTWFLCDDLCDVTKKW
jgi:hypothetical protein